MTNHIPVLTACSNPIGPIELLEKNSGMPGCFASLAERASEFEELLCLDFLLNKLEERFLGGGVAGAFKDKRLDKIFEVLTGGAA